MDGLSKGMSVYDSVVKGVDMIWAILSFSKVLVYRSEGFRSLWRLSSSAELLGRSQSLKSTKRSHKRHEGIRRDSVVYSTCKYIMPVL